MLPARWLQNSNFGTALDPLDLLAINYGAGRSKINFSLISEFLLGKLIANRKAVHQEKPYYHLSFTLNHT
jgi:hypothetical protein